MLSGVSLVPGASGVSPGCPGVPSGVLGTFGVSFGCSGFTSGVPGILGTVFNPLPADLSLPGVLELFDCSGVLFDFSFVLGFSGCSGLPGSTGVSLITRLIIKLPTNNCLTLF